MKKMRMLRYIVSILLVLPEQELFSPKAIALELCRHTKMLDEAMNIYQLIIDSPSISPEDKSTMYYEYGMYCMQYGFVEEGLKILRKKLAF